MNNKIKLIIIALALVLLIAGAGVLYNSLSDKVDKDNVADNTNYVDAPDFTVYDSDGNPVKLSDKFGKPMVINFWASWCGVCKAEMPDFEKAYREYGDDVVFMMINVTDGVQETREMAEDFLATVDYTFPVYYDETMEAGIKYRVSALPTTYFANADGQLVSWGNYLDYETLKGVLDGLLEK